MSQLITNYRPPKGEVPVLFHDPEQLYRQFKERPESIPEYHSLCVRRVGRPMGCDYFYKSEEYFKQRCSSVTAPGKNRCPYHDHPVFSESPTLDQFKNYQPHTVIINIEDLRVNPFFDYRSARQLS